MKKILVILLISLGGFAFSNANNLVNDSTVTFITYFDKGDSYDYTFTKTKQKYKSDSLILNVTAVTDFNLTVIDSTENSYIFDWQNLGTNIIGETNPALEAAAKLSNGTKYTYKTSEMGEFQELINWEEIRDFTKLMVDTLIQSLPDMPAIKDNLQKLLSRYDSKEFIESTAKSVQLYHTLYGTEFTLNDTITLEDELPNPLGGDPLPAIFSLYLSEINAEDGYCKLVTKQIIDKEKSRDFILQFLKQVMPKDVEEKFDENKMPTFEITDNTTFIMDLNYGWMLQVENVRTVESDKTKKIETMTIDMKFEDEEGYTFNTWESFLENFDNDIRRAEDVYENLKANGLKKYQKSVIEIHFESDSKTKLQNIREFLESNYGFTFQEEIVLDDIFGIRMTTDSIPVSKETLTFFSLDMAKRAYEYDCGFDALRIQIDKSPNLPSLDSLHYQEYIDKALEEIEKGSISKALIYWTLLIEIDSTNPVIYYNRALSKDELFHSSSALLDYDKALEISPDYTHALLNRGVLKDDMEDFYGAISDFDKLISLEPDNAKAYYNRGNTKIQLGEHESACIDWKKAIEFGMEDAQEMFDQFCK